MDEMILNVKTLPEPLYRRIRSERVRVHEENGVITLTPIEDPGMDIWGCLDELRGIFSDGRMSSDKFMEQKRFEKELER